MSWLLCLAGIWCLLFVQKSLGRINRSAVLEKFDPHRIHANHNTPLQVGNGNFAFNVDITGLQSIKAFNTLSDYIWHTSPEPFDPYGKPLTKNSKRYDFSESL
jgi:hypothetical protein